MNALLGKLLSLSALVELALGWTAWAVLRNLYPQQAFSWLPFIPVAFFLMAAMLIFLLLKTYKKDGKKLVNLYMAVKLVKLVFAMIYILVFYFVVNQNFKIFIFTFAAFYAVYIALETFIIYSVEKQIKKQK
ncbi:MAG: hypothetical protein LBN23_08100 [Paludibacter sp.]|jgi:hypothetical protein|nr:hypothetical protein [Paludibacter sp.]